eukprot:gene1527-1783_t
MEGLQMDDLDALLADLGRPSSGIKTNSTSSVTHAKPLETKVNLNEIESLMQDLQTSSEPAHTHHNGHTSNNNNNNASTQAALDTSDDLDALMESLNSSISSAIKATNNNPETYPVKSSAPAASTYTSTSAVKAPAAPSANGPVKYTSTATVVTKKAPVLSKATIETTHTSAPARPSQAAAASLSTDDLDELLKNLNPQTPVVDHHSHQHSHQHDHDHSGHNHNHNHNHHHHQHHHHQQAPAAPVTSATPSNSSAQLNATAKPAKVIHGDDLDNLLSNLTSQMNDIDNTGPTPRGICGGCRKPILGETIQAMGKLFHPEHFMCQNCNSPIGTRNFYEQEGIPHCEKCYHELFCARCAHCDDPITDRCITALGKKWHIHHFVCTQCLKPFEGGNFFERDGRPYCETDFYSTFAARCGGCNQPIRGECINALGTQWHPEHFVCQYCQKSFASGTFFEFGGKPYCDIHYHQQAGSVCSGCGKAVSGRCVDALDKKWHPEHFVCAFCMNPLAGGSYTANNGKPYCKTTPICVSDRPSEKSLPRPTCHCKTTVDLTTDSNEPVAVDLVITFLNVTQNIIALIVSLFTSFLWIKGLVMPPNSTANNNNNNTDADLLPPSRVKRSNSKRIGINSDHPTLISGTQQSPSPSPRRYQLEPTKVYYNKPPSRTLTGFSFMMLALSAVSFPSVINAFYFIFVIGFILCLSSKISIHKLMLRIYPFFLVVSFLHLLLIYLFQIQIFYVHFGSKLDNSWYGLSNYTMWDVSKWPLVIGYVTVMLLYISSAILLRQHLLYIQTKARYHAAMEKNRRANKPGAFDSHLTQLAYLFSSHGWSICCIEIIVVCFYLKPSIFTSILLFSGLVSTLIPLRAFKLIARCVLGYLLVFIIAQYCFNIPNWSHPLSTTAQNIGFILWPQTSIWIHIGVQLVLAFTFGLYSFYADTKVPERQVKAPLFEAKKLDTPHQPLINLDEESDSETKGTSSPPLGKTPVAQLKKMVSFQQQLPPQPGNLSRSSSVTDLNVIVPTSSMLAESWSNVWTNVKETHGPAFERVKSVTKSVLTVSFVAVLSQSYQLALFGLFFCGLTSVSLLNAGYMLFFILFVMSEKMASRLWILLIVYAQSVLLLLYVWQLSWLSSIDNSTTRLIGVIKYTDEPLFVGLIWHLVIITFTLTQWNVNRLYRAGIFGKAEDDQASDSAVDPNYEIPASLRAFATAIYSASRYYSLPACYLVLVLVASFSQISIISLIYMASVFLCLIIHHRSANGSVHIRRFWPIVVISQGIVLIARYVYQFNPVNEWLIRIYPDAWDAYLTLSDIGLQKYPDDELFRELLGNVAILVVCVFQLSCFFSPSLNPGVQINDVREDLDTQISNFPRFQRIAHTIARLTFLHGPKVVLWTVFLIALNPMSYLNYAYVVMIVVSMAFKKGTYRIGFFLILYSQLVVLVQMASIIPSAQKALGKIAEHTIYVDCAGLVPTDHTTPWSAIKLNLTIILIVSIQQTSYWWTKRVLSAKQQHHDNPDDLVDIDHAKSLQDRVLWYMSHFYELYGVEVIFVVLSISLCWRVNILGILYLLVIAVGLNVRSENMHRLIWVSALMVPIILVQYLLIFGQAPSSTPSAKTCFPTPNISSNPLIDNLLLLSTPSRYIIALDFSILFFSMLLFKQPARHALALKHRKNFLAFEPNGDFITEPRTWNSEIRYIIARYSSQATLLIIFIAGTAECDLVSLGYVLFSVYVLFGGNAHSRRWNNLWRAIMVYNWCILLSQILFQALVVKYGGLDPTPAMERAAAILGFSIVKANAYSTARETISDAIIMLLISLQKTIYESDDFEALEIHLRMKRDTAYETALVFYKTRRAARIAQLSSVQSVIEHRRQRLLMLKSKRNQPKIVQPPPIEIHQLDGSNVDANNNNNNAAENQEEVQLDPIIIDHNKDVVEAIDQPVEKPTISERISRFFNAMLDWLDPPKISHDQQQQQDQQQQPEDGSYNHHHAANRNSVFVDSNFMREDLLRQEEEENNDPDSEPKEPSVRRDDTFKRIVRGISTIARDESKWISFMAMIGSGIFNSSIISLFYVFAVFIHGRLFESPRPSKVFWRIIIGYSSLVIIVKYVFRIKFAMYTPTDGVAEPSAPWYTEFKNGEVDMDFYFSWPFVVGLFTMDGGFLAGSFWDLAVFLCCLWHRHVYRSKGLWSFEEKDFINDIPIVIDQQQPSPQQPNVQQILQDQEDIEHGMIVSDQLPPQHKDKEELLLSDQDDEDQHDDQQGSDDNQVQYEAHDNYDSWSSSTTLAPKQTQQFSYIWNKIKKFVAAFYNYALLVVDTSEKTGRDYYIPLFFTAIPSADITQFLEQNVIPRQYIAILLVQFGLIILDRIIYIYRSVKAKFALQVVLTILYHAFLFFYFPKLIHKPFDFENTWTLVVFYILKCIYLYYSALQICYGYPILTEGRFLMDGYSDFHNIGFSIYRAIPFVFEMRTLLDWIATDTTLLFYDWLKFEDLYATIFSVHCRQEWIKRQGRKKGHKQPVFEKFTTGVTFFVGLVLLLWFPLIILSSGLPGSNIEPVTSVKVQVSIMGWSPFVSINQDLSLEGAGGISNTFLSPDQFKNLTDYNKFIMPDDQKGTQIIQLSPFSEENWNLSPPAKQQLIQYLNSSKLSITAEYTLTRSGTVNVDIPGSKVVPMTAVQQMSLINILNSTDSTVPMSFNVTGLFYEFIRLPGVSGGLLYPSNAGKSPAMLDVLFTMSTVPNTFPPQQYWSMTDLGGNVLQFYTISSKLPNGLTSTLVSAGIIGLYVGVVLSVGRFLRMYVTGMALRITLENIQVFTEVEKMIDDVLIARQYGDLDLEEELYNELIQVFRQSTVLYEMTKKQI